MLSRASIDYRGIVEANDRREGVQASSRYKEINSNRGTEPLATGCGARMRDSGRAPWFLRLCAAAFAHRTCTSSAWLFLVLCHSGAPRDRPSRIRATKSSALPGYVSRTYAKFNPIFPPNQPINKHLRTNIAQPLPHKLSRRKEGSAQGANQK